MAILCTKPKKKRPTARQRVEKAGPTRAQLKKLVKKHHPPQSWFDQDDNPFVAEGK